MNVAGRSRPGEATERKSQRQGPGCIKPCFEIIAGELRVPLILSCFFATRQRFPARWGVGGKRRGLGPRNDVLTICKAVTLRFG